VRGVPGNWHSYRKRINVGRNEMDPPLCGLALMSQNEFKISEFI
jgi:hypothetical protein